MTIGRRSTRDIAVAAEAISLAHIEDDRQDRKRVEQALADQRSDRVAMHADNKAESARTNLRIDSLEKKVDGVIDKLGSMPIKIVVFIGAIFSAFLALQQIIMHGLPQL